MQITERVVDLVLIFVFQGKQKMTLQALEHLEQQRRARTLGRLFGQMRGRFDLHPALLALLDNFIEHRNQLIHRIRDIPGWDLETTDGRKAAIGFLSQLQAEDLKVMQVFLGFVVAWENQH
jgi:hypothetical protein